MPGDSTVPLQVTAPAPAQEAQLAELRAENSRLNEQVKRLVRTEGRLYTFKTILDDQRVVYRRLAEVGREISGMVDLQQILEITVQFVLYSVGMERCLILMRGENGFQVNALDGYYDEQELARVRTLRLPESHPLVQELDKPAGLAQCPLEGDAPLGLLRQELGMDEFSAFRMGTSLASPDAAILVSGVTAASAKNYRRLREDSEWTVVMATLSNQIATTIENNRRFEALTQRNREVEHANQMKSAFLATMSHELRTPMNAIIGFTRLVIRKASSVLPELQLQNLRKVERSALGLLAIINDILDLSKVESGRVEVQLQTLVLGTLVEETLESLRPLAVAKGLELTYLPQLAPPITTDPKLLRQVLTNLISNAVKFTKAGGVFVELAHQPEEGRVLLSVRDTGIGIPPEQLERIFEPFHQVDNTMTREVGGTGLGLSIVRELLKLVEATVSVVSQMGEGSTFTVSLPVTKAPVQGQVRVSR